MKSSLARTILAAFVAAGFLFCSAVSRADDKTDSEGWITLFDGKSLAGWKANENPQQWKVENGAIVAAGPRSHLFYVGDDEKNPPHFKSFHFKADVMTTPGSNSGIYFHTKWEEEQKHKRFPQTGFEAQVNNSHRDPVRTASIYHLVKNFKPPAKDNEWFTEEIIVDAKKKNIKTFVNGQLIADYTEPPGKTGALEVIDSGTFAFQAHDPKSTCYFKNIKVKPLD
jgi:hypothetical protein